MALDMTMEQLRALPPADLADLLRKAAGNWVEYKHGEDHLMYFAAVTIDRLLKSRE